MPGASYLAILLATHGTDAVVTAVIGGILVGIYAVFMWWMVKLIMEDDK